MTELFFSPSYKPKFVYSWGPYIIDSPATSIQKSREKTLSRGTRGKVEQDRDGVLPTILVIPRDPNKNEYRYSVLGQRMGIWSVTPDSLQTSTSRIRL